MRVSICQLRNWLAVYHSPGVGSAKFHAYLRVDPHLAALPTGITPNWSGVESDLAWLQQPNTAIITLLDDRYPSLLKNIPSPPPLLYVRGDVNILSKPQLAIVGSRRPTAQGLEQAEYFARHFASLGFVVVSGLALGIDSASHKGALAANGGQTIAVLGNGVDYIYPAQNRSLTAKILTNGCLVSEFPIGTKPIAHHFPRRNRIISGLSLGVLVVEAAQDSGSLITAKYAGEQGREIFAIPGSISNSQVKGCHELIRQGAKLVESPSDVLEELPTLLKYAIRDKNAAAASVNPRLALLSTQQHQLLNRIDYEVTNVDIIVERVGLSTSIVGGMLLELELQGLITAVPGGYARKLG